MNVKQKEQFEAFNLLGKASKYLQNNSYKTDETVHGVHRAMASILKDLDPVMDEIKKDNPNMVEFFNLIKKAY